MKEDIREQSIEAMLKHVLALNAGKLVSLEQEMLLDVLVKGKTFKEIAKPRRQNIQRQKAIFNRAFVKLINVIQETGIKLTAYEDTQKELVRVKAELNALKGKISRRSKLTSEIKELLDTPIDETELSARVKGICSIAKLRLISDIVLLTRSEFLKLRNCGKTSTDEMEQLLLKKGLSWGMQV